MSGALSIVEDPIQWLPEGSHQDRKVLRRFTGRAVGASQIQLLVSKGLQSLTSKLTGSLFSFSVKSKPFFYPSDWSVELLGQSLASHSFHEDSLKRLLREKTGYDQHGSLFGQVFLNGPEREELELNLPGMRERRWGEYLNAEESVSLIGVCRDGKIIRVGFFGTTDGVFKK